MIGVEGILNDFQTGFGIPDVRYCSAILEAIALKIGTHTAYLTTNYHTNLSSRMRTLENTHLKITSYLKITLYCYVCIIACWTVWICVRVCCTSCIRK